MASACWKNNAVITLVRIDKSSKPIRYDDDARSNSASLGKYDVIENFRIYRLRDNADISGVTYGTLQVEKDDRGSGARGYNIVFGNQAERGERAGGRTRDFESS